MPYQHIFHHGAVNGVMVSCHQLQIDTLNSLSIDDSLLQGTVSGVIGTLHPQKTLHLPVSSCWCLPTSKLIMSDAFLNLLAACLKDPIVCSDPPSPKLLPLVLEGSLRLELSREPAPIDPCLKRLKQQIIAVPFHQWFGISQK